VSTIALVVPDLIKAVYTIKTVDKAQSMQNSSSSFSLLWRRALSFLYDSLLLISVFFLVTAISLSLNNGQAIEHFSYKIILFTIGYLFFDWFWRHGGQTLGMRAWNLQLATENGQEISRFHTLKRYVLGSVFFGFTLLFILFSARKEAIHDTLSGTTIIIKNK